MGHSTKRLTTAEFVTKAQAVHGEKYDYSETVYVLSGRKVGIRCPVHGPFEQNAGQHLLGRGCAKCGFVKTALSANSEGAASFLSKAKAVHGDKYDYSQVQYVSGGEKVVIICPEHGPFEQNPTNHVVGKGCMLCRNSRISVANRHSIEDFLGKARAAHGERYDYSLVKYGGSTQKVTIMCTVHGPFQQAPVLHISGHGCRKCGNVEGTQARTRTTAEFIADAQAVHGNRYDYSRVVEYSGIQVPVLIGCRVHGFFKQTPLGHLAGNNCKKCAIEETSKRRLLSPERFIADARLAHGNKYDYSLVNYTHNQAEITIVCPVHGPFQQRAKNHRQGFGCAACGRAESAEFSRLSWIEKAAGYSCTLYLLRFYTPVEVFYKVGITVHTVGARYAPSNLAGYNYEILALYKSTNAAAIYDWEQSILETFAHLSYTPKTWFAGATECFSEADPILAIFPL